MTLVREGSSEGRRPRVRGRRFGDRRYHRRSLGWLAAAAAAAVATVVVVEWCWGVGTGGKWGQINADMCGKLHRDRSQDPRGKRGLCVFLSVTPSLAPPLYTLSTSVCSDSHFASLHVPSLLKPHFLSFSLPLFLLALSRGFRSFAKCSFSRVTNASLTDIIDDLLAINDIFQYIIK